MKERANTIRKNIKEEIHKKYGHEIQYAKDCQILSESILKHTNRQLSVTTLKRFFGIVQSPFNPSKYTLDTLAVYLNFKNWQDFVNSFEYNKHVYSHLSSWEHLKSRTNYLTNYSLNSIYAKTGHHIDQLPVRSFAIKRVESFLNSSKKATAFIAPNGYGKSTLMYQIADYFFTGEHAKYPEDIAAVIDGSILVNLINLQTEITWVHNLLDFNPINSFSNYFRQNPKEVKGRFILIIDGINEIFHQTNKLIHFTENLLDILASYERIDWFKLIITCRPDVWKIFTSHIRNNPSLRAQWFDVSFEEVSNATINVPLLEKNEIKKILERKHSLRLYQYLNFHYPEITELIKHPYFLNLFSLQENLDEVQSDIELLNRFVFNYVLSEPYAEEKSKIIDTIFHLNNYGKNLGPVKKSELPTSEEFSNAYKELIAQNILYEYSVPGSYLSVTTFVKFSNNILVEFLLANKWLSENQFDLNLIKKIIQFYDSNHQLCCNLIKYLIKIAFKEGQTELLKNVYSIFTENSSQSLTINLHDIDAETINVIGVELRKNKKIRDYLIPHFAKSRIGQLLYFETFFDMDSLVLHAGENVKYYLENNPSDDAQIYGHYLRFLQYFMEEDLDRCNQEFTWFRMVNLSPMPAPLNAALYDSVQVIFLNAINDLVDQKLWETILNRSDSFFKKKIQIDTSLPIYEYLIVTALNYGNRFGEINELAQMVLKRYVLSDYTTSWMYQLFMAIYARALLNLGETEKAVDLFKNVEFKNIPANYYYFVRLRYYLIKVEFLLHEDHVQEAKELLKDTKVIAQMIRFKYFFDQAQTMEEEICQEVSRKELPQQRRHRSHHE